LSIVLTRFLSLYSDDLITYIGNFYLWLLSATSTLVILRFSAETFYF